MRHLSGHPSAAELLDLAEGVDREKWAPHVTGCDACRSQLEELTSTMTESRAFDVPEPSPLFWDHLSARVHDRIASEPPPSWIERWMSADRSVWMNRRTSFGLAIAAVCVVALAATTVLMRHGMHPSPATVGASLETPAAPSIPTNDASSTADDPSWSLMVSLASDVDWDDAAAEGLTARSVGLDRAIGELSSDEKRELQLLLTQELSRSGA